MWGEGGHEVGKNGEKWIFLPEIFFFRFRKRRKKRKIFEDQNARIYVFLRGLRGVKGD